MCLIFNVLHLQTADVPDLTTGAAHNQPISPSQAKANIGALASSSTTVRPPSDSALLATRLLEQEQRNPPMGGEAKATRIDKMTLLLQKQLERIDQSEVAAVAAKPRLSSPRGNPPVKSPGSTTTATSNMAVIKTFRDELHAVPSTTTATQVTGPSNMNAAETPLLQDPLVSATQLSWTSSPPGTQVPAVLVVGGTDGSGTRRVVQVLTELGVKMVSEDPKTFDIHADIGGGWPALVHPVLKATQSLVYDPMALKPTLRNSVSSSLDKLLAQTEADSARPLDVRHGSSASNVQYGFKAPVAMTLAPWWAHMRPHFKFLHVVRDGRDIAFSSNQGPVQKFYNEMYRGNRQVSLGESDHVKATRLWSDWNSQVNTWAQMHTQQMDAAKDPHKSFGYSVIHAEDLASSSVSVRFHAISGLAAFVGSSLDGETLCCLALQDSKFMGSHDHTKVGHLTVYIFLI
jgi:hypothetical protein